MISGKKIGQIYFWDHELEVEDVNTFFVAASIDGFLESLCEPTS
jgi:hypothetical protein